MKRLFGFVKFMAIIFIIYFAILIVIFIVTPQSDGPPGRDEVQQTVASDEAAVAPLSPNKKETTVSSGFSCGAGKGNRTLLFSLGS